MEKIYKTKAIVLARKEWRENDLLFSLFTEDFGRIEAVAVGTKKIKSKLAGHLAVAGIIEILFVKGKSFKKITHAYLIENFFLDDYADYQYLNIAFEMINKILSGEEKNNALWKLLVSFSRSLIAEKAVEQKKFLLNIFIVRLLSILGYKIKINECLNCGKPLVEHNFDYKLGGFVCRDCGRGPKIDDKVVEFIKLAEQSGKKSFALSKKNNESILDFLHKYLTYHLEIELKAIQQV